jgi:DNA-binding transcriptional LysR family regulator
MPSRERTEPLDWADVRVFLTVAQRGSLAAAARALGVDQTTVGRRLAALERAAGTHLVEKSPAGITLTRAGHRARRAAEAMADAAGELSSALS